MSDKADKDKDKPAGSNPAENEEDTPETLVLHRPAVKNEKESSRHLQQRTRPARVSTGTEAPHTVTRYEGNQVRTTLFGPTETNVASVGVNIAVMNRRQKVPAEGPPNAPVPPTPNTSATPVPNATVNAAISPAPNATVNAAISPVVNPSSAPPAPPTQTPPAIILHGSSPGARPRSPDTTVLKVPQWKRGGRRSLDTEVPVHPTTRSGPTLKATTYDPVEITKRAVKVQFTVLKKKTSQTPPPPPPLPPPPPPTLPEPPPPQDFSGLLKYVNVLSGLSREELEHEEIQTTDDPVDFLTKTFDIPNATKNLDNLLDKDTIHFDFGGLMRQYYSYVLRSYCLVNMQERYRGASGYSNCFTTVDLSKIGTRDVEIDKLANAKMKKMDDKREQLRQIAVDDDHFNYLKTLADNQTTLLPLTIVHSMNEQLVPVLEDIFKYYGKSLGTQHDSSKEAGFYYMRIRKRCEMYNHICGGSTLNENLTLI